jgi:hypothetical protein
VEGRVEVSGLGCGSLTLIGRIGSLLSCALTFVNKVLLYTEEVMLTEKKRIERGNVRENERVRKKKILK